MKSWFLLSLILLIELTNCEGKKLSLGRGSSSRRTSGTGYKSAPAPISQPAIVPKSSYTAQQKPSLSGWQESSAGSKYSKPSQTHSYPSSGSGLSGNGNHRSAQQDNLQRSHSYPQNTAGSGQQLQHTQTNNQNHGYPSSHGLSGTSGGGASYPASTGLSGNVGTGAGYPKQQGGLSGASHSQYPGQHGQAGAAPPPYSAPGHTGAALPPYSANNGAYHSGSPYSANNHGGGHYHQPPPPPYSNHYGGGYGSMNHGAQAPGYFGNYANNGRNFGGMSRSGSALTGVGIAGAGIGTVLTGLALWNLARSTGNRHNTVVYDNRGQPVAVQPSNSSAQTEADSILADLVNCSLTIDNGNSTEVLAIPCSIATSFTPDSHVEDVPSSNSSDKTKCIITVLSKSGREFMTTIPCSILLNSAKENNVTEPPSQIPEGADAAAATAVVDSTNVNLTPSNGPGTVGATLPLGNCSEVSGINPLCSSETPNLSVVPISDITQTQPPPMAPAAA